MIGRFHEVSVHAPDPVASLGVLRTSRLRAGHDRRGLPVSVRRRRRRPARDRPARPRAAAIAADRLRAAGPARRDPGARALRHRGPGTPARRRRVQRGAHRGRGTVGAPARGAHAFAAALRAGETSRLGWFEEFALPVADMKRAEAEWERLGFVPAEEGEEPYPHVGLTSDSLNVALLRAGSLRAPALVFTDADMPARIAKLAEAGFEFARRLARPARPLAARAPRRARRHAAPADDRRMSRARSCSSCWDRCRAGRRGLGALRTERHRAAAAHPARGARLPAGGARDRHRGQRSKSRSRCCATAASAGCAWCAPSRAATSSRRQPKACAAGASRPRSRAAKPSSAACARACASR